MSDFESEFSENASRSEPKQTKPSSRGELEYPGGWENLELKVNGENRNFSDSYMYVEVFLHIW